MTYIEEIGLVLKTAERIDEQMQHASSQQLLLILLGVVLVILMLLLDNTIWRIVILGPLFWAPYYQYQLYKKLKADDKILLAYTDQAELLLRNPILELGRIHKDVYAMRIHRLKL